MKRIISIMLVILLLGSVSFAETSEARKMTPEEQAYNIYLDIACVYEYGVRYLEEMGRIWEIALSAKDVKEVNNLCYFDCFPQEPLSSLYLMYMNKYGYSENELRQLSSSNDVFSVTEKTDLVWAVLALEVESGYLKSPKVLKVYLDRAFDNIRTLMAADKEYAFLSELKDYYKDAVLLYEYIADFKDNYTGFSEKLDDFKSGEKSWKVDFEFIFDPAGYSYVSEVRAAQSNKERKQIYDQATVLEAKRDYAGAIELYWECRWEDAFERIEVCHKAIEYATAESYQDAGEYREAYHLFISLGDYLDSMLRAEECGARFFSAQCTRGDFSYSIDFDCDSNKNIIFKKSNHSTFPTETVYVYENGKLVSSTETGIGSYTDGTVASTYTTQTSYNEYGDPVIAHCQYKNASTGKNTVKLTTTWDYSYDAQGFKTAAVMNQETLSPDYPAKYEYEFEYENNRIIKRNCYITTGNLQGELYTITTYEYDDAGRILCEISTYYTDTFDGMREVTEYDYR